MSFSFPGSRTSITKCYTVRRASDIWSRGKEFDPASSPRARIQNTSGSIVVVHWSQNKWLKLLPQNQIKEISNVPYRQINWSSVQLLLMGIHILSLLPILVPEKSGQEHSVVPPGPGLQMSEQRHYCLHTDHHLKYYQLQGVQFTCSKMVCISAQIILNSIQ